MFLIEQVVQPAARHNWCEVLDVRRALGSGVADAVEATETLLDIIGDVSNRLDRELGYPSARERVTQGLVLHRKRYTIPLPRPINPLVHTFFKDSTAQDYTIVAGGLLFNVDGYEPGSYRLDYEAGWTVDAAGVNVPGALRRAAVALCVNEWSNRGRETNLATEALPGVVAANFSERLMPQEIIDVLDSYRKLQL